MMVALLLLAGCWRPEPYTPPEAPGEPSGEPEEDGVEDPSGGPPTDEEEGVAPDEAAPDEDDPDPAPDEDEPPPYTAFATRTVQAPVTIVDDWGKPLAVLARSGWELEVRGMEDVRARVWCGTCSPAVEGWLQNQYLERLDPP